jgi:phenylpyruvate tautomerase PptA (4-oxalocrotonate tautomerase family)
MPTVLVYWSPGRSPQQKADVIRGITDSLVAHGGARREDVLVIFQDIQPGDAGRGGDVLQAPAVADNAPTRNGVHDDAPD